jgi:hypothetical protein
MTGRTAAEAERQTVEYCVAPSDMSVHTAFAAVFGNHPLELTSFNSQPSTLHALRTLRTFPAP